MAVAVTAAFVYGTTNLLNTSKWRWQQQKQQQQWFETRHVEPLVYLEWRGRELGPGVKLSSGIFFWLPIIARLTTVVIFVCFFACSFFLFLICFFLLSYAFFVSYIFFLLLYTRSPDPGDICF